MTEAVKSVVKRRKRAEKKWVDERVAMLVMAENQQCSDRTKRRRWRRRKEEQGRG